MWPEINWEQLVDRSSLTDDLSELAARQRQERHSGAAFEAALERSNRRERAPASPANRYRYRLPDERHIDFLSRPDNGPGRWEVIRQFSSGDIEVEWVPEPPQVVEQIPPSGRIEPNFWGANFTITEEQRADYARLLEQQEREHQEEQLQNLRDELSDIEDRIREADEDDRQEDLEYYERQHTDTNRRLRMLESRLGANVPPPSNARIVNARSVFVDFPINQQKTQIALVQDRDGRAAFSASVQTNRGSYQRRTLQIAMTPRGLVFRRLAIRRDMAHGFQLVHRRDSGECIILERKEPNATID